MLVPVFRKPEVAIWFSPVFGNNMLNWDVKSNVVMHAPYSRSCALASPHYRRRFLCRVFHTLLSVFYRALGKEALCRVPDRKNSANIWHSAKIWFAERRALGKKLHSAKICFAECRALGKPEHSAKGTTVNGRQPPLTLCRVSSPDSTLR